MLLGLVVAATVLLGLELLLSATRGIWDPPAPNFRILRNRSDPEAVAIDLGAHATVLGETMLFHIVSNELTRPDPELLFRVRPNPSGDAVYGYTGINAQGFRGRTIDVAESLKHKSVVILGDSCGFGWGIRKFERTWAATLEQKLMESDPDFRIYNLSQPGYSTAQASLGDGWVDRVATRVEQLCRRAVDCVYLDLSLHDPRPAAADEALHRLGFRFGCIVPELRDGDVLRLQLLNGIDPDPARVATASDFGKTLLEYVASGLRSAHRTSARVPRASTQ